MLGKALERNSFAQNIRRRQLEADYEVATAKGNLRSIDLFATIGYTGQDREFNAAYRNLLDNQVVQVGVKIPILDWGKRRGQVKVAQSNREVVLSQIRQEQTDFNQDIFLLVENFNNQARQLDIAAEADRIAQKRYDTSVETFMIGRISTLDLNDAQNSKDEARQKHISELYYFWYYFYQIRSVTLWDFERNTELEADFEDIGPLADSVQHGYGQHPAVGEVARQVALQILLCVLLDGGVGYGGVEIVEHRVEPDAAPGDGFEAE